MGELELFSVSLGKRKVYIAPLTHKYMKEVGVRRERQNE